ncbi:MAG: peroxiredoxin [Candidatus Cloacimonetes bacterium]|nr:peroxiredoxin [Candidatus Cloacimonadota bacterium]
MSHMKLQIGDKAPDFKISSQPDKSTSLRDYTGKWIVLYFYPRDNTPGCTLEARDFSCLVDEFAILDAVILGVSKDSLASHRNFITRHNLNIELLSDPGSEVMKSYGVWRMKNMHSREFPGAVRSTFLIDPEGRIAAIWDNVRAKGHAEAVLGYLKKILEQTG